MVTGERIVAEWGGDAPANFNSGLRAARGALLPGFTKLEKRLLLVQNSYTLPSFYGHPAHLGGGGGGLCSNLPSRR